MLLTTTRISQHIDSVRLVSHREGDSIILLWLIAVEISTNKGNAKEDIVSGRKWKYAHKQEKYISNEQNCFYFVVLFQLLLL